MRRRIKTCLLAAVVVTGVSYALEWSCSCGDSRGLPLPFVHPFALCLGSGRLLVGASADCHLFGPVFHHAGRLVIGANPDDDLFVSVFDVEWLAYDILIWSMVAFILQVAFKAVQPRASPNGGPAARSGDSRVTEGPPSVS